MTEARGGKFVPMMIGLHWPSLPWGDERLDGQETTSFAPQAGADADPVDVLIDDYASRIADTPAAREALRTIIEWSMDHTLERELPPEIVAAYATLNAESGLGSAGESGDPSSDREPFDPQAVVRDSRHRPAAQPAPHDVVLEEERPRPRVRRDGRCRPARSA